MRLMAKSDIDKAKAAAQRQSIDEGLKLAKRVDALREVSAAEEASLERFRSETLKVIHAEITEVTEKRDTLKKEVADLEALKVELQKPLDEEWVRLYSYEQVVMLREDDVKVKEMEVLGKLTEADNLRIEAQKHLLESETAHHLSLIKLKEASTKEGEAFATFKEADKKLVEAERIRAKADSEFTAKEKELADREQRVIMAEANLKTRNKELTNAEKRLRDREAMLERNLKRNS